MSPLKSFSLAAVCSCLLASAAQADVRTYCNAYARDAANGRVSGGEILGGKIAGTTPETSASWIETNGKALADCLAQYGEGAAVLQSETAPEAPPKPKPVARKKPAGGPGLAPGSAAWNAYCDKKYTSFDPKTGKYRSFNGIMRPCKAPRR